MSVLRHAKKIATKEISKENAMVLVRRGFHQQIVNELLNRHKSSYTIEDRIIAVEALENILNEDTLPFIVDTGVIPTLIDISQYYRGEDGYRKLRFRVGNLLTKLKSVKGNGAYACNGPLIHLHPSLWPTDQ
jgi:hypothetical protein